MIASSSSLGSLIALAIFWIAPAIVAYRISARKGRRNGWLFGVLSWLGVLIAVLLPDRRPFFDSSIAPISNRNGAVGLSGRQKQCPECAADVREEARLCKHCGHRFDPDDALTGVV